MDRTHLNEHDANQGAQSKGEFLGMTGNSGWYLLGSAGASILMVILCWGILGVSLLLCLLMGVVLCGLSVAYVFALKNNKPAHYDTDFFESALVEAGVIEMSFGPRMRRPANPFKANYVCEVGKTPEAPRRVACANGAQRKHSSAPARALPTTTTVSEVRRAAKPVVEEPTVTLAAYENLREELDTAEEMLEDAFSGRGEI